MLLQHQQSHEDETLSIISVLENFACMINQEEDQGPGAKASDIKDGKVVTKSHIKQWRINVEIHDSTWIHI
eukprot:5229761-Karenia_brevis.AAC.1